MDALGCFLVTDYMPGAVHSFTSVPTLKLLAPAFMLGLEGPCWVVLGPNGGFAVNEEFGVLQQCLPPPGFLGGLTGPAFGSPACVRTDSEGNVIVTDKQQGQGDPVSLGCGTHLLGVRGAGAALGHGLYAPGPAHGGGCKRKLYRDVPVRQDSKLGKFLGKWNRATETDS